MEDIYNVKFGKNNKCIFTEKQEELIVNLYTAKGKTLMEIAELFGLKNKSIISKVIKSKNIKVPYADKKKYKYNENYFDVIDTQDKAYILGLLYADGCNNDKKGTICLQLQEEDKHILEQINKLIENEKPLYCIKSNNKNHANSYSIVLYGKKLCETLNGYGVTPRKSLVLEFPKWLDKNLYFHFIRGYIDGDGCCVYNSDKNIFRISMVGTNRFLEYVQNIFKFVGIKSTISDRKHYDNGITKELYITSNKDSMKLACYLYYDANLKITRKYNKCVSYFVDNNLDYNFSNKQYGVDCLINNNEQMLKTILHNNAIQKNIIKWGKIKTPSVKCINSKRDMSKENNPNSKQIYCPELDRYFWGATEVYNEFGIDRSQIGKACKGKINYAGKHPETKEPLHWVYIDANNSFNE